MDRRFKILVVDDDPVNVKVITAALRNEYEILPATSGQEAVDQVKVNIPDLILLDVMMPGMSGFEVCSILKADPLSAEIPVIFLTALDSVDGELQGLELGCIDYLAKPMNFALLKLRVRNHLALKERTEQVISQRDLLARQNVELEAALARVKQLEGIIPICMYCKKIRDDRDMWYQLEQYITEHSEAKFSHGICPHCIEEQMDKIKEIHRAG